MNRIIPPLVSVYITNFNYANFIRQSVESVLSQTLQDFELLIIDDGSTDNSREIIESYRDHPQVSIIYQQNKGLNVTNNIAMRASHGKYLIRLDADDYLTSDALETMCAVLENDASLGLVFPDYYYVDVHGHITGEEKRHDFDSEVSLYDQPAHGACTMIRLEFLKNLGGYNESFICQDGYDLWIKFIMHHKVTNVKRPLFYYRRHGNNLTKNEERILHTRKKIKETFVETYQLATPETVAVIPVRNTMIGDTNWPLSGYSGRTVLKDAIEKIATSEKIQYVVATSSDANILDYLHGETFEKRKLYIIERPPRFAQANESLGKTIELVLKELAMLDIHPEAVMTVALEYPFLTPDVLDDAVNTLAIFKSDALLSVRPDNRMYYQHVGHGMVPLMDQDKFTKLEREALYKGAGGIVLSTVDNFRKNKKMISGKVGHIVVNEQVAFGVFNSFDLKIFDYLANHAPILKNI